jgi:hypothetical protein
MPEALDVESDPLFELLTDALRAGPGSPAWHSAVQKLRGAGAEGSDEYRLLYAARERLESGREFRSVRAGPQFTRRLFTEIDSIPANTPGVPTANVIVLLSSLAILAVLGSVGFLLLRGGSQPSPTSQQDLATIYFPQDLASATFEGRIPPAWQTIGKLPLQTDGALRPTAVPMKVGEYVGGGVVLDEPLMPDEPFAVEALLSVPEAGGDFIAEVFVADSTDFDERRATSPSELVWLLDGRAQRVMVRGRNKGQVAQVRDVTKPLTVRIVVEGQRGLVQSRSGDPMGNEETVKLWEGSHGLAPDKSRHVGVRFIRGAGESKGVAEVRSVRVLGKSDGPEAGGR